MNDIDLINYIINRGKTAKEAAEYFNVSLSTIRKRLKKIREELPENSVILKNLNIVIKNNEMIGKKTGGSTLGSGKKKAYTIEQIKKFATSMLENRMTIEEASIHFNIPRTTLYEYIKEIKNYDSKLYNDLQTLFEYNKNHKGPMSRVTSDIPLKYVESIDSDKEKGIK